MLVITAWAQSTISGIHLVFIDRRPSLAEKVSRRCGGWVEAQPGLAACWACWRPPASRWHILGHAGHLPADILAITMCHGCQGCDGCAKANSWYNRLRWALRRDSGPSRSHSLMSLTNWRRRFWTSLLCNSRTLIPSAGMSPSLPTLMIAFLIPPS
jgi:hypothetical protein